MNIEIGSVDSLPQGPLDELLSAAWAVRPLSTDDVSKLARAKRWYRLHGVGLSKEDLRWLTRLAKRGGWRPSIVKGAQHAS